MKSKVIIPHSKDCGANRWSGVVKREYWGNRFATSGCKVGNHHLWYVVSCNDTKCGGEKAVNSSVLAEA